MTKTHYLKTWPIYFGRLRSGEKTFEVRKNDRDYQTGDTLVLQEYEPGREIMAPNIGLATAMGFTGSELTKRITYTLHGGQFGIEPGHVVMGLADVEPAQ